MDERNDYNSLNSGTEREESKIEDKSPYANRLVHGEAYYNATITATPPPYIGEVISSNRAKDIEIKQLDYGWTVRIGCQLFAVEKIETILAGLKNYLNFPAETEKNWMEKKTF